MSKKLYDALIIGGGPGGLSVAQGLCRVNRTCAFFSDSNFRNAGIHAIHNVLTRDGVHPEQFRHIAREQIRAYGTTDFINIEITTVEKVDVDDRQAFKASGHDGQHWQGRTLAMATGSKDLFPPIEGFMENWPQNMHVQKFLMAKQLLPFELLGYHASSAMA